MLKVEDVTVSYDGKINAVDNVSFEITEPAIIGILGPNGAGKSTLIKGMLKIIPSTGKLTYNGQPLKQIQKKIAYVEQKTAIDYSFPIKVNECVSLGLYPNLKLIGRISAANWKKVDQALELVKMKEFKNRQIGELSGGQFQRILIARTLVQDADLIFLDEPFIGIDALSEEIIMDILKQLKDEGKMIVIVHHDLRKVKKYFDRIVLIDRKIVAYGETEGTFVKNNVLETFGGAIDIGGELV